MDRKDEFDEKLDEQLPEKVKTKAEEYDDEVKVFTESLQKIESVDELNDLEKEIVEKIEENEKRVADVKYELEDQVEFRGQVFNRSTIAGFVADLLDKQQVGWQMTLGLFDLIDFWKKISQDKKNTTETIPYAYYDATLRFLGQQQYKGYDECKKVLLANNLFTVARDKYLEDLSYTYFLANKHNAVLERIDAINSLNTPGAVK